MKKPEPTPVTTWFFDRLGELGEPNRGKNFSNGDPGANPNSSAPPEPPDAIAVCSILTRTEITAGFTLATISAKPTGTRFIRGGLADRWGRGLDRLRLRRPSAKAMNIFHSERTADQQGQAHARQARRNAADRASAVCELRVE